MDIEKLTHRSFRLNLLTALVLSAMLVTFASLVGRGMLNLKASLFTEEPSDLTVVLLLEPHELSLKKIYSLPKREDGEYRYSVETREGEIYFVRIDKEGPPWKLATKPELLRNAAFER